MKLNLGPITNSFDTIVWGMRKIPLVNLPSNFPHFFVCLSICAQLLPAPRNQHHLTGHNDHSMRANKSRKIQTVAKIDPVEQLSAPTLHTSVIAEVRMTDMLRTKQSLESTQPSNSAPDNDGLEDNDEAVTVRMQCFIIDAAPMLYIALFQHAQWAAHDVRYLSCLFSTL